MSLSKNAQTYLDHFEQWDPEGQTMRNLWAQTSQDERDEIHAALRERMHARNAEHACVILSGLPKKWRDEVLNRIEGLP